MRVETFFKKLKTKIKSNPKVFVIGFNKTGTTTIKRSLWELGYSIGDQKEGEALIYDWRKGNYKPIFDHCKTSEAFQDIPFSLPDFYKFLMVEYPNAKFILSVRDNPEQWYNSLCNFHTRMWGVGKQLPTKNQLMNANYLEKGFAYFYVKNAFKTLDSDLYNKDLLINSYKSHIANVKLMFSNQKDTFIEVNVANKCDYERLCFFLDKKPVRKDFLWENKTSILN